ncbi:MAG: hypothetical protein ABI761_16480 [Saprospiraceae bacterium]
MKTIIKSIKSLAIGISVFTILIFSMGFKKFFTNYQCYVEDDFRAAAFTVNNHVMDVSSQISGGGYSMPVTLTSTSCGVHDGFLTNLDPVATNATNDVQVTPSSANDYADYTEGVTTIDNVLIGNHCNGTAPFTTGYQFLSADGEGDEDADTFDTHYIRDMILGVITVFPDRDSWDWLKPSDVSGDPSGFLSNPWQYRVKSKYSGTVTFSGLTRNQIASGSSTNLRTTKIGDVGAPGGASHNSWVCNAGLSYFNPQVPLETRTAVTSNKIIPASLGSEVIVSVRIDASESIRSIELPIHFDHQLYEVLSVSFENGFLPYWHFNLNNDRLTMMMYNLTNKLLDVQNGNIAFIHLKSKREVKDVLQTIYFSKDRQVEISNEALNLANAKVQLTIENVISNGLEARILSSPNGPTVEVNLPRQSTVDMQILNVNGQILATQKLNLLKGLNKVKIPSDKLVGINILVLSTGNERTSLKFY